MCSWVTFCTILPDFIFESIVLHCMYLSATCHFVAQHYRWRFIHTVTCNTTWFIFNAIYSSLQESVSVCLSSLLLIVTLVVSGFSPSRQHHSERVDCVHVCASFSEGVLWPVHGQMNTNHSAATGLEKNELAQNALEKKSAYVTSGKKSYCVVRLVFNYKVTQFTWPPSYLVIHADVMKLNSLCGLWSSLGWACHFGGCVHHWLCEILPNSLSEGTSSHFYEFLSGRTQEKKWIPRLDGS